jgi:hypothetical protein
MFLPWIRRKTWRLKAAARGQLLIFVPGGGRKWGIMESVEGFDGDRLRRDQ